jgi:hypothetical protein
MKKTYKITFMAELTEDGVRAMNKYFYDTMNESMEIENVWGLELKEEETPDIEEAQKYTMHWEDVVDGLYACKTIDEVNKFLDTIPKKFGEWWVDEVDGHYEVTNEWMDEQSGELNSRTFDLKIEVKGDGGDDFEDAEEACATESVKSKKKSEAATESFDPIEKELLEAMRKNRTDIF